MSHGFVPPRDLAVDATPPEVARESYGLSLQAHAAKLRKSCEKKRKTHRVTHSKARDL